MTDRLDDPQFEIHFLDVGQGDCTLLVDHGVKEALLVDCHSRGVSKVRQLLADSGAALTGSVITHFHADHYAGVPALLYSAADAAPRYNPPGLVLVADRAERARLRSVLASLKSAAERPASGTITAGDTGSLGKAQWTCHAPTLALLTEAAEVSDQNRASVVMEVVLPGLRVMLTGDADGPVWKHVLTAAEPVDVLQVSHHGGIPLPRGSTEPGSIVARLQPRHSVVSVGRDNLYGHPAVEWLAAAQSHGSISCTQIPERCQRLLEPADGRTPAAGDVTLRWWNEDLWDISCGGSSQFPQRLRDPRG